MAAAVHNSLRQFGQALGVAVLGALVYANVAGGQSGGARLTDSQAAAFMDGLHVALLVAGGCLVFAALIAGALIPRGFLVQIPAEPSESASLT
jgi:hypothetical protein